MEEKIFKLFKSNPNKGMASVMSYIVAGCLKSDISEEEITDIRNHLYSLFCLFENRDKTEAERMKILIALKSIPEDWADPENIYKDDEIWLLKFTPEYRVWITNDGDFVPIETMETKHIINTMKCLEGKSKTKIEYLPKEYVPRWLDVFRQELRMRNNKLNKF